MLLEEKRKLTSIIKNEHFSKVLKKITVNEALTDEEKSFILAAAILFLKFYERDNRFISFADFAYYIILKYSLKYQDFQPLYDFSLSFGFYPIAKSILNEKLLEHDTIIDQLLNTRLNDYLNKENYIETLEQNINSKRFLNDSSDEKSYLAPTSFGKSSLIVDYIKELSQDNVKIAIVVPTKSLLMQTYRMIRFANLGKKILIHDEMYNREDSFIAIFTQERSLRLLNHENLFFDVLIIDEAHNLLKEDKSSSRNILLARLIAKNRILNPNQKVIYLSPLISEVHKLRISKSQEIKSHNIKFNIKEPELFEYLNNKVYQYNRFANQFYEIESDIGGFNYFINKSQKKNFIYETSPKKIEKLAKFISSNLKTNLLEAPEIVTIINNLKTEVHESFYAIDYVKSGLIYLHGQIPDIVKEYLESKFSRVNELNYIVANSVILEGMNLPIDALFIFNTWGLQGKELINLIGRVNRLNTIFLSYPIDFRKLLPQIHFINTSSSTRTHTNKIKTLRSRIFEDIVKNPLLAEFDFDNLGVSKDKKDEELNRIQRIQENEELLYSTPTNEYDKIKQSFIEADIISYYSESDDIINNFIVKKEDVRNGNVVDWTNFSVIDKIEYVFIHELEMVDFEFVRLRNNAARNYYDNYIHIGRKKSFNERVKSQILYFQQRAESSNLDDRLYYMGKYGEIPKYTGDFQNSNPVYVDLSTKNDTEKANLAIVKLKMEDDFISFKINKFVVLLYDYELINSDEYNLFIYGTTDENKIALTKYGLNINLVSKLETDNQLENLQFDSFNNLSANENFNLYLETLSDFQRFEIQRYL